ncbi:MAG: tetratricopeptide repeat protein [Opitutaceae bacterium]|nr:tetratricopeptide repeat protein [Opitutaceae bacterium]
MWTNIQAKRPVWLAGAAIALAALAAYHNSFGGPFLFDDEQSILHNPSIRSFSTALTPPGGFGFTVSGRPLLNLSLALNYAVSGTEVWSYHALNLLIHVLAGLTLFGLVRRTLALPVLAGRFAGQELPAAFVIALLWTLHPLQTESVTYLIQRAESLMGLFYLLTLYGFVRAATAASARGWQVATVAACALGMACKEVMVTAPVVAVLYDRTFLAGSFRAAWERRRGLHAGLFATWLPLAWLVATAGGDRGGTFVLTPEAFAGYWLTQFEAVARYLQLALWPSPLVFEYGVTPVTAWTQVLPYAVPVVAAAGATLWALRFRPVAGFLGAAFFLILAPTSLLPGITQTIVEHRMYLPLAAVIALVAGAVMAALGRRVWPVLLVLALVAGGLTARRNADYQDEFRLWQDTVTKRPTSAKAQNNLGRVHFLRGELPEARQRYELAVSLDPGSAQTRYNLGLVLDATGQPEAAIAQYAEAVRILPYFAQARLRTASALLRLGRPAEAVAPAVEATRLLVEPAEAYFTLGQAQAMLGRPAEAAESYRAAVKHDPAQAEARLNLGIMLAQAGELAGAREQLGEAARLRPQLPEAHANLGIVLAESGRLPEAVASFQRALELRPDYAAAHYNLGNTLLRLGRVEEARGHFTAAVKAAPDFEAAREMLERLR